MPDASKKSKDPLPPIKIITKIYPYKKQNADGTHIANVSIGFDSNELPFSSIDTAKYFLYNLLKYVEFEQLSKKEQDEKRLSVDDFFKKYKHETVIHPQSQNGTEVEPIKIITNIFPFPEKNEKGSYIASVELGSNRLPISNYNTVEHFIDNLFKYIEYEKSTEAGESRSVSVGSRLTSGTSAEEVERIAQKTRIDDFFKSYTHENKIHPQTNVLRNGGAAARRRRRISKNKHKNKNKTRRRKTMRKN